MKIKFTDETGRACFLDIGDRVRMRNNEQQQLPDRDLRLINQVTYELRKKEESGLISDQDRLIVRDLARYMEPPDSRSRRLKKVKSLLFFLVLTLILIMSVTIMMGVSFSQPVALVAGVLFGIFVVPVTFFTIMYILKKDTVPLSPEKVEALAGSLRAFVAESSNSNSNIPQAVDITQLQPDAHVGAEKAILHEPRVQIPVSAINNSTLFKTENVTFISENHNTPQVTEIAKLQNSSHVEKEVVRIPDTTPVTTASRVKDSSPQPSYATPHFFEYEEFVQSSESLQNNSSDPTYAKISGLY